jgi:hypothetical protein
MDNMSSTLVPKKKIRALLQGPTKAGPSVGSNDIGQAQQYQTFALFFYKIYFFYFFLKLMFLYCFIFIFFCYAFKF